MAREEVLQLLLWFNVGPCGKDPRDSVPSAELAGALGVVGRALPKVKTKHAAAVTV